MLCWFFWNCETVSSRLVWEN